METFLTIFCVMLVILMLTMMNLAIYKTIIEIIDDFPKWLNRVLLIPPFSFVAIGIILIVFAVTDIATKLKKHW